MGLGTNTKQWVRTSPAPITIGGGVKRKVVANTLASLLCLGLALPVWATEQLQQISYSSLPGDKVEVRFTLSGPAPEPGSFTIDNPPRIALDLPDTELALSERSKDIGIGVARSVRAVEAGNRTRVVINLSKLTPHEVKTEGNDVVVVIAGSLGDAGSAQGGSSVAMSTTAASNGAGSSAGDGISMVDFRRGEAGEGRVVVELNDPNIPFDVREKGGQIIVDFLHTTVPAQLQRRLTVTDFATPVKSIETFPTDGKVRMVITPIGDYTHLAYQTGTTFTLEVKPITQAEKEKNQKEKFGYTGERLSLNFQNIEVRAVLQLLADFTGFNLVTSDTVSGNVTLRLKNVPWDQALDIILKTKGLDMRKTGNVLLVAPAEEIAAREKAELQALQQLQELAPLRSESIQVNYAKASDLAELIKNEQGNLISERGSISLDERTNKLLVKETQENIDQIRALVEELDIPVRQVLIESRIVIANDDYSRDLGVRFGVTGVAANGRNGMISTSGSALNNTYLEQQAVTNLASTGSAFPVSPSPISQFNEYNVDLPAASTAPSIALAVLGADYLVDLELSALQSEGRGEVVSNPRVVTANQKKALIEQGVEIPYLEASSSGAVSVSFKKAVLSLDVTPQITPDERVIMDLNVHKDSVGEMFNGVPSINTREVNTQVLVNNGETIVLGGIYEQTKSVETDKVPVLGDLPLLGALFRNTLNTDQKAELLIFVTPKILRDGLASSVAP